jgi:hypothetical protein
VTQLSRIVTAFIEPIEAKKLLPMKHRLKLITASHDPGTAAPDYDHPITKALVQRLPVLTYGELEAVRAQLMKEDTRDARWINSTPVERDGWIRLVNAELQSRDRARESAADSLIDFLTKGARP